MRALAMRPKTGAEERSLFQKATSYPAERARGKVLPSVTTSPPAPRLSLHSGVGSHPDYRQTVDRALRLESWSLPLVVLIYLLLAGMACFRAPAHDQATSGLRILGLAVGTAGAWAIYRIIHTRIVQPWLSGAFAGVALRLRDRALHYSIRDFRGWVNDTPGIAALVQSDQLLLCDRSTGYDELLLSKWQVAALHVEHERGAARASSEARPVLAGLSRLRRSRLENRVFLRIYYFVRHDGPPSSTRIPFGGALRDAEGWKEAIERSKRHPADISA